MSEKKRTDNCVYSHLGHFLDVLWHLAVHHIETAALIPLSASRNQPAARCSQPSAVTHVWVPGVQGTTGLSDLQRPPLKNTLPSPHHHHQPASPPSLSAPPNTHKVPVNGELPWLLLCRSVSGYLIVTLDSEP